MVFARKWTFLRAFGRKWTLLCALDCGLLRLLAAGAKLVWGVRSHVLRKILKDIFENYASIDVITSYIPFQIVIGKTCPKLWPILDTLGPWGGDAPPGYRPVII